jgi:hypothetical protein
LSMVCYARLYGRDEKPHRQRLRSDLSNLNNRIVILLPNWSIIERRYYDRGDEIQDIESLRVLYDIFSEETHQIRFLPNVIVLNGSDADDDVIKCISDINYLERQRSSSMGTFIKNFVRSSDRNEVSPLKFSLHFDEIENDADETIMLHPPEKEYYQKILNGVLSNIENELAGRNEYGKSQMPWLSRRFIFTQDSCISLIHTMLRDSHVNMHVVCRSSDVVSTFPHDLKFLVYLLSRVQGLLSPNTQCVLNCTLNSAHIID